MWSITWFRAVTWLRRRSKSPGRPSEYFAFQQVEMADPYSAWIRMKKTDRNEIENIQA